MDDLKIPKILEFIKRKSLTKGRVQTTLRLFMLDADVVETIVHRFAKGEVSVVESRVGVAIKHPKDKFDKKLAKDAALSRLEKRKYRIINVVMSDPGKVCIVIDAEDSYLQIVKDDAEIRIYEI